MAAPQKLDVYLEGLGVFQEGASALKAGDGLCLQQDGVRLACVTQSGTVVGLLPADKRALLSRGPWSGTVRSVKRQTGATTPAVPSPEQPQQPGPAAAAESGGGAAEAAAAEHGSGGAEQQSAAPAPAAGVEQQAAAAGTEAVAGAAAAAPVVQVLVRFTPEEQRWQQRGQQEQQGLQVEEEDTARLSTEHFHMLAGSEELRWMLRDERLQKVVADIDGAADRERALIQALQAPNFKEFADKVLAVVAPDTS